MLLGKLFHDKVFPCIGEDIYPIIMIFQVCRDRYNICEYGNVKPLVSCAQVGASLFLVIIVVRILQIVYELNLNTHISD